MRSLRWVAMMLVFLGFAFGAQAQEKQQKKSKGFSSARELLQSLRDVTGEFADPDKPTEEEIVRYHKAAFSRIDAYLIENPGAMDRDVLYGFAQFRAERGYGEPGFIRLCRSWLKDNPEGKQRRHWQMNALYAELGHADHREAALAELAALDKDAAANPDLRIDVAGVRLRQARRSGDTASLKRLTEALNADQALAGKADIKLIRKRERTVLANWRVEVKAGQALPDWGEVSSLHDIDGGEIKLAELRGKVVVLHFWATWCRTCLRELPELCKLYKELQPAGLEIISVSLDLEEGENSLRELIAGRRDKRIAMPWRHVYDGGYWDSGLARRHGVRQTPRAIVLDREGKVLREAVSGVELHEAVRDALNEAKPGKKPEDEQEFRCKPGLTPVCD